MYTSHLNLLDELKDVVGNALELTKQQISKMNFNLLDLYADIIVCRLFTVLGLATELTPSQIYKIEEVNKYAQVLRFSDKSRALWMTQTLSTPYNHMSALADSFDQNLQDAKRTGHQAGAQFTGLHVQNALQAAKEQTGVKSYLQYSAHDTDLGNIWWFMSRQSDWHTVQFSSYVLLNLGYQEQCILDKLRDAPPSAAAPTDNFRDCLFVSLGSNGKPLGVGEEQGED